MTIITEDYVSNETFKLLKEKGFDDSCCRFVIESDETYYRGAPTLQMAMKWLREEKNIIINMWYNGVDWDAEHYNNDDENFYLITNYSCNSYEEAVEAALKYCLENLI